MFHGGKREKVCFSLENARAIPLISGSSSSARIGLIEEQCRSAMIVPERKGEKNFEDGNWRIAHAVPFVRLNALLSPIDSLAID